MQIVTYAEHRHVKRHRGTMPILLTSPHGGSEAPAGVSVRSRDSTPEECEFNIGSDLNTATITEAVAQTILGRTGLSPYVAVAQFHRKFIDANRPEPCAFTDPDARPFYQEYHNRIAGYVDQILEQNHNQGFLFDIHGTTIIESDPADIYLGTANGNTLPPPFDRTELFHQHGFQGLLKWARHETIIDGQDALFQFRVSPPDATAPETIAGGFTVRHYGDRINSVQIEIARPIREDPEKRVFLVEDMADAMINFVRRHARF